MPRFTNVELWWQKNQLIFLLPPIYGSHKHLWERIDSDSIGCTYCGIVHICGATNNIVPCNIEIQDDTSTVCTYTGLILSNSTLFDEQISINDFNLDYNPLAMKKTIAFRHKISSEQKFDILNKITSDVIDLFFFSKQAQKSQQLESQRYNKKISIYFCTHVNQVRFSFSHYCVLDGIEFVMNKMKHFRTPVSSEKIPNKKHFREIQYMIVCLLSKLILPRPFSISISNPKIKNLIVSLLYLCADGISVGNCVYLPKVALLKRIMPLELVLLQAFDIQPKIVTDGENIVKMCINESKYIQPYISHYHSKCDFENSFVCNC